MQLVSNREAREKVNSKEKVKRDRGNSVLYKIARYMKVYLVTICNVTICIVFNYSTAIANCNNKHLTNIDIILIYVVISLHCTPYRNIEKTKLINSLFFCKHLIGFWLLYCGKKYALLIVYYSREIYKI